MKQKLIILFLSSILFFSLFSTVSHATTAHNDNLALESIPPNHIITNYEINAKKRVLILNSYHKGLEWTDDIEVGIKDALGDKVEDIEFIYEYMDAKRDSDPIYLDKVNMFLKEKYTNKTFDAIIVTDDQAFEFVSDYSLTLFKDIPIVFCGVNFFDQSMLKEHMTGVVESNDFKHTIDVALTLHPDLKRIIVINDTTLTGQNNRKSLDKILPNYANHVAFEFWSDVNMTDIQENVKKLGKNDIILLLSFNKDQSSHNFSHQESIELISQAAETPIYGMLDFYMGHGLFGGMVTSGFVQGQTAGKMVGKILDGTSPQDIPIIEQDLGVYMFDYNMLKKYNIKLSALPKGSLVINRPFSIKKLYENYRTLFISICLLISAIIVLSFIIYLLLRTSRIKQMAAEKERLYAMTDMLTGIPNRRACFNQLNQCISHLQQNNGKLTIAFLDVNHLKHVNDSLGHVKGDELIKRVCDLIQDGIEESGILYRMGGDEFLIVFNGLPLAAALYRWNNVTKNIDTFNQLQTKPFSISVSIGFIEYNLEKHHNIDELIEDADKKMYENKMTYRKKEAYPREL